MWTSRQDRAHLVPLWKNISGSSRWKHSFNSTASSISVPNKFSRFELKKLYYLIQLTFQELLTVMLKNKVLCVTCNRKNLKV